MGGKLKVDGEAVAAIAHAMASHGSTLGQNATAAERALNSAAGSVRSPQLSGAVAEFVSRLAGQTSALGEHVGDLGTVLTTATAAVAHTDTQLATGIHGASAR